MATCPNSLLDNILLIPSIPSRHGTNETRRLWGKINVPLTCPTPATSTALFIFSPTLQKSCRTREIFIWTDNSSGGPSLAHYAPFSLRHTP